MHVLHVCVRACSVQDIFVLHNKYVRATCDPEKSDTRC